MSKTASTSGANTEETVASQASQPSDTDENIQETPSSSKESEIRDKIDSDEENYSESSSGTQPSAKRKKQLYANTKMTI